MKAVRFVVVAVVALLGTSCGASPSSAPGSPATTADLPSATATTTPAPPTSAAPTTPAATPTRRRPVRMDKLLVFVVENHSLDAMRREMPFTFGLARKYGYATSYRAITHPSLPNYLAMTGGDTYGVTDDKDPAAHPVRAASVFAQALAAGRTAKTYAEGMDRPCRTSNLGRYAVRHNPWTYHVAERSACARFDLPLTALARDAARGRLPNAGLVVPDTCHDAHDCPAATADAWLRQQLAVVMGGPDWRSGRLGVVVTADEDDHDQGNLVLTVVVSPQLRGRVVTTPLTHYSLARLYAQVLGVAPLRLAATAPSLAAAFRLRVGPAS
jgi:acid phosphatase